MLCQFVLHLLQQYAAFNQGQTSVAAAVRLRAEAAQEACRYFQAARRTQCTLALLSMDAGRHILSKMPAQHEPLTQ